MRKRIAKAVDRFKTKTANLRGAKSFKPGYTVYYSTAPKWTNRNRRIRTSSFKKALFHVANPRVSLGTKQAIVKQWTNPLKRNNVASSITTYNIIFGQEAIKLLQMALSGKANKQKLKTEMNKVMAANLKKLRKSMH